jgi:hypothetical protein
MNKGCTFPSIILLKSHNHPVGCFINYYCYLVNEDSEALATQPEAAVTEVSLGPLIQY